MARTVSEIKKELTDKWIADPYVIERYNIDSSLTFEQQFSKGSIENILFYIWACISNILENLFDKQKTEIIDYVDAMKPHSVKWYIAKIKAFQKGDKINEDTGEYDILDDSKQIIKYCSISEALGLLSIKIATDVEGKPSVISYQDLLEIKNYISRVKDAGVHFELISRNADNLRLSITVHYDPLILNSFGERINGIGKPVEEAIKKYIQSMPFDSVYSNMGLIDSIQQAQGVMVVAITKSEAQYGTYPFTPFTSIYKPDAGYMQINEDSDLNIVYKNYYDNID